MPSPVCEVKDGAGAYQATTNGVNVTPANTVTIRLAQAADVWSIACITTDETSSAAAVNASLVIDSVQKTATFTAPAAGKAYRFQSTINGGLGPGNVPRPDYITTFCVYTLAASGRRAHALDETFESNATFGYLPDINAILRTNAYSVPGTSGQLQTSDGAGGFGTPVSLPLSPSNGGLGVGGIMGSPGQLLFNNTTAYGATPNVTYSGGGLVFNTSGFTRFGTNPGQSGYVGLPYATGTFLSMRNDTNTADWNLIGFATTGTSLTIGDTNLVVTLNAFSLLLNGASSGIDFASGGQYTLFVTSSALRTAQPIGGEQRASMPLRWKKAAVTINGTTTPLTLSAAQYECPRIVVSESAPTAGAYTIVLPDVADAEFLVKNTTAGTVTVKKPGVSTGFTIAAGKTATARHNGSDYERATQDA